MIERLHERDPVDDGDTSHHGHAHFEHLRRRLQVLLLLAYVIPLALASIYFHFHYSSTLRRETDAHLRSIAENQRNTVDLFLQERIANVRAAFHPGEFPLPPTDRDMERVLGELRYESATFSDVGVFDPAGILVAYAGPYEGLRGRNYHGEDWFQRLHTDPLDHYLSDLYLGFRERPHFVIAVRRAESAQSWTLRASVDPQQFGEFVGRSNLVDGGEAFIVNRNGTLQTIDASLTERTMSPHLFAESGETRIVEMEENGREYVCATAGLNAHDWAVVVRLPLQTAYAPVRNARLILSGLVIVAVVLVVTLAFRSTRRLVARLEAADVDKRKLQRQLFDAAKLATVGEMAAGVAHEINNPLAIIYEEAGMLRDILDPQFGLKLDVEELRSRLEAISEATMRGRTITGKLLVFSRRHKPDPEPTEINAVLDEVLAIKEAEFKVENIEVERDLEEDLPQVSVNRNEMQQVLLNLLNNAKDAIGRDGRIHVRSRSDNGRIELSVEDTGCGMPDEVQERIFIPFFTTKEVGKGTGLGLSISARLIESMGGQIGVASALGKGTTFTISLPAIASQKQASRRSAKGRI